MRDGQGNPLSSEEVDKVKAVETGPEKESIRRVSIDPGPGLEPKPGASEKAEAPATETAPKF